MVVLTCASWGALLALVAPLRTHLLFAKVSLILPLPDSCCRPQDLKPVAKVWTCLKDQLLRRTPGLRARCEVLVPDDKQKNFMWVVPCVAYLRFFWYFRRGPTCLALDPTDSCYSN